MCIAIVQIEGSVIDKSRLRLCYEANDDGCGFAYAKDGKAIVFRSMDFETFYEAYAQAVVANMESKFLIHFRIGTQGKENEDNCHPFQVNEQIAFIHNGVIPKMPKCTDHSDTWYFNENVLKKLPDGWIWSAGIHWMLEESIGWSKLCVLHAPTNEVLIINESAGVWESDGNWYSNKSYQPKVVYTPPPKTSKYKKDDYYRQDWQREWWVGSQRRRYHEGKLQGFDYDRMIWRNIDSVGLFIDKPLELPWEQKEIEDSEYIPLSKMEDCECCPGRFSREDMYLARFKDDVKEETFWMCITCRQTMEDYITLGMVTIIGEERLG